MNTDQPAIKGVRSPRFSFSPGRTMFLAGLAATIVCGAWKELEPHALAEGSLGRGGRIRQTWATQAGLGIDDETGALSGAVPAALAIDASGNTCVAGRFVGTVHLGSSTLKSGANPLMFVSKLKRQGAFAWARQGDAPTEPDDVLIGSEAQAIAVDAAGSVFVAGVFSGFHNLGGVTLTPSGGAFVARLDSAGSFRWVRQIGVDEQLPSGGECDAAAVAVDSLGNLYVAGTLRGTRKIGPVVLTSGGGSDGYVAKLDANGRVLWATCVGGAGDEYGRSLAVNNAGDAWLAGTVESESIFDPTSRAARPRTRAFVTRLSADGAEGWTAIASGDDTQASAVVVDSSNTAFLTGGFLGNATFGSHPLLGGSPDHAHVFVTSVNSEGRFAWATQTAGEGHEQVTAIVLDVAGVPYVTGALAPMAGTTRFGSQVLSGRSEGALFVGRLSRRGGFDWACSAPNIGSAWSQGIALDPEGAIYLTGSFRGSLELGSATLVEPGNWNLFVTRLTTGPPKPLRRIR